LESNEDELDKYFYNLDRYKSHDFLYKIDAQDYDEIMAHFDATKSMKKYLFKDKIRKKITKILTLDKLDSVFFTDREIYIKNFIKISEKDGGDRRACGVEPALLEEYKNRYFFDNSWKNHTFEFLKFVIEDALNFRKLNPYEFKKIFISVFINMMELIVIEKTVIEEEKSIKGFSLYLLREMFDEFLLYISEDVLFHFSNQDKKAIAFISFFNVNETIDSNGIKYKANPILDAEQHAWNMTTIRSTMLQYKHAKQDTYNKKSALSNQKKKFKEYSLELKVLERLNVEKSLALSEIEIKSNQTKKI